MAKRNYYQHQARLNAMTKDFSKSSCVNSYINGFEEGFELALKSLQGVKIESKEDLQTWRNVWTKILTDENEWNYKQLK